MALQDGEQGSKAFPTMQMAVFWDQRKGVGRWGCPGFLAGERENNLLKSCPNLWPRAVKTLESLDDVRVHLDPTRPFLPLPLTSDSACGTRPCSSGMFRILQNMLGNTLGCSSPAEAPPDHSWGLWLPLLRAQVPHMGWRWSPPCARPCPAGFWRRG